METSGEQGDISSLCQFRWYNWCYFRDHKAPFPHNQEVLGHVLGPSQGEGNELSQWVKRKQDIFDALIERTWGSPISTPNKDDTAMTTDTEDNEIDDDDETTK